MLAQEPASLASDTAGPVVRIKDIARSGTQSTYALTGVGLVTGLAGQGDSSSNLILKQTLAAFLSRQGLVVEPDLIKSKNVAVVTLGAVVPSHLLPGDRLDLQVSSLGDARSLEGGMLLATDLQDPEAQVLAQVQGKVQLADPKTTVKTQGWIPQGLEIKRMPEKRAADPLILFRLHHPDAATAGLVASALKKEFPGAGIRIVDPGQVELSPGGEEAVGLPEILARAEGLTLVPDPSSKVVVNRSSGVVVMGRGVRIAPVTVSVRGAKISLGEGRNAGSAEQFSLDSGASVEDLVTMLQRIGLETDRIIETLRALETSGALYGTLEVIGR